MIIDKENGSKDHLVTTVRLKTLNENCPTFKNLGLLRAYVNNCIHTGTSIGLIG